jgi:hypothetical protein
MMRARDSDSAILVMNRLKFFAVILEEAKSSPMKGCEGLRGCTLARDFNDILAALESNKYGSTLDWMDNVELVIRSQETSATNPYHKAFIGHIRDIFVRSCHRYGLFTMTTWTQYVAKLKAKVSFNMQFAPANVKSAASPLMAKLALSKNEPVISLAEMKKFVQASELLTTDEDHEAMIKICGESEDLPELVSTNITLDLVRLKLSTVRALQDFVRNTLEQRGISYPQ